MRLLNHLAILALGILAARAQSNFDADHSAIGVETIGALDWSTSAEHGAVINQFYATGYIYGANIGWIHLGAGPVNNFQHQNNSATDFGVNITASGELRGFAYGANVGWINFEPMGNPRVDWATGKLSGRIWAANLGWIELEPAGQFLRLESLPEPPDSDDDGLPDAWEMLHASNLTTLARGGDADADGQFDIDEYSAGTNPLVASDRLLLELSATSNPGERVIHWPTKLGYVYVLDQRSSLGVSASWTPVSGEAIIGTGSTVAFSPTASANAMFYRVRAYPPLSTPVL